MRSLFALLVLVAPLSGLAADSYAAATDPSQTDADFPFVGEYVGTVASLEGNVWRKTPIGLQVAALGDGKFEATEYLGGLPGAGWDGRDRVTLPGRREGEVVRIEAVPVDILLDGVVGRIGHPQRSPAYGLVRRLNRTSPTLGMRPPREAVILFNGRGTDRFSGASITNDGLLVQGAETKDAYSDFTLHVEFRLPYMPGASDQGRANSGVYLQRRYEVQILDSFGDDPVFNNAAAVYRTKPADLNMSLPPLAWQTYDIRFRPAKFDDGKKIENARLTVWHNGVKVHDEYELPNTTGAGKPEGPDPLPTLLQDHKNPVRFRNVWLVDHFAHPKVDATPKITHGPWESARADVRPYEPAAAFPAESTRPAARVSY